MQIPPVAPPPLDLTSRDLFEHGFRQPDDDARASSDALGEPANVTAQMPVAPPPSRLDEILAAAPSPPSSGLVSSSSVLIDPRHLPMTRSGQPVPTSHAVRRAFLATFASDDPPAHKLVSVVLVSFFATLALSAFVAWAIYLIRH